MVLRVNKKYEPLFKLNENIRYVFLIGGRGAGRSHAVSSVIVFFMRTWKFFRGAIMRLILGDVRNSNFQEILDRIEDTEEKEFFNVRDLEIDFKDNVLKGLGFRKSSGEQRSKMKSLANFNVVHIEEGDEVAEDEFMQLDDSLRTKKGRVIIFITLNAPDKNHWIIKRWFNLIPSGIDGYYKYELKESEKHNTLFIFTTFEDNLANLSKTTIANYIRYEQTNPDYFWNMIKGYVSEGKKGRIFKNWQTITDKEYEELPYATYNGQDFGYTNDPTANIEIKQHNNKLYLKELIYETGLTNPKISKRYEELGIKRTTPIYADSAEPKSIEEIRQEDWNILPAMKGKDSVKAGLDFLMGFEVYYTESSVNIAEESQNYCWALDRNKEPTNEPIDKFNHAIDGIRYGVYTHNHQEQFSII